VGRWHRASRGDDDLGLPVAVVALRELDLPVWRSRRWVLVEEGQGKVLAATVRVGERWVPELVNSSLSGNGYRTLAAGFGTEHPLAVSLSLACDDAQFARLRASLPHAAWLSVTPPDFGREVVVAVGQGSAMHARGDEVLVAAVDARPGSERVHVDLRWYDLQALGATGKRPSFHVVAVPLTALVVPLAHGWPWTIDAPAGPIVGPDPSPGACE